MQQYTFIQQTKQNKERTLTQRTTEQFCCTPETTLEGIKYNDPCGQYKQ